MEWSRGVHTVCRTHFDAGTAGCVHACMCMLGWSSAGSVSQACVSVVHVCSRVWEGCSFVCLAGCVHQLQMLVQQRDNDHMPSLWWLESQLECYRGQLVLGRVPGLLFVWLHAPPMHGCMVLWSMDSRVLRQPPGQESWLADFHAWAHSCASLLALA